MSDTLTKNELLPQIQESYDQLQQLLSSLSPAQLILPNVNGSWSVKDNLAHLTSWMSYTNQRMQTVINDEPYTNPFVGQEDDEINERFYQVTKDRPYAEIQSAFQTTFHHFLTLVEALTEEQLHTVSPSYSHPLIAYITGNSIEHFQEHRAIIEQWLARQ